MASTTVLAAVSELAETYHTDAEVINLSNEFYMLFMGLSPLQWGPLAQLYGKTWVYFCPTSLHSTVDSTLVSMCT